MWLALWLTLAGAQVPDSAPEAISLTEAESKKVADREVAVQVTASDTGGMVTGIVDVDAPIEDVWREIFNLEARVAETGGLKEVEVYERSETQVAARFLVKVLYTSVEFHIRYTLDPASGWSRYTLDTSRPNDLVSVEGAYQLYRVGGKTRFVYRSITDSGRRIPQWIRNWLAVDSLGTQMTGIRDRAEASATP